MEPDKHADNTLQPIKEDRTMTDPDPELTPEELQCLLHDEDESTIVATTAFVAPDPQLEQSEQTGAEPIEEQITSPSALVPAEAVAALEDFTRDFAEKLSSALTERLQVGVFTEVTGFAETTLSDFVQEMAQPTCLEIIESPSLTAPFYWEWSPQILFPLLDRLLGGGQLPPTIARRPLTDIEQRLVISVSDQLLEINSETWQPAIDLTARLERIESNPRSTMLDDGDLPLWAAELQIDIGTHQGPLRIAYDLNAIAEISEALIDARKQPSTHSTVSVVLAESFLDQNELLDLRVGDIISTDAGANDRASIFIDDEFAFHGVPGAQAGKKAVRIVGA